MTELKTNQNVRTPNGPGVVEGVIYENGCRWIVVRHQIKAMTGTAAGERMTIHAKISSLWRYELGEIERLQNP